MKSGEIYSTVCKVVDEFPICSLLTARFSDSLHGLWVTPKRHGQKPARFGKPNMTGYLENPPKGPKVYLKGLCLWIWANLANCTPQVLEEQDKAYRNPHCGRVRPQKHMQVVMRSPRAEPH